VAGTARIGAYQISPLDRPERHTLEDVHLTVGNGYIRWANRRAKPKRRFAVDSKIRRPDYLPNVA
jgi:hypothetical protein